ncbi:MAG: hypothetical protein LBI27_03815 [Clostridiales bacterium]|jgi:hypothetical protein|nr:hypothetical protein [Clostridiales bacterium]
MDKNHKYLVMMMDIFTVSKGLGLKTYIWGGFAVDILHGEFTREHDDLDCFTENLVENHEELQRQYEALGYSVNYIEYVWMLQIEKGDIHATFNSVKNIDGIAHWHHAGMHGTVFFPYNRLDDLPRTFYGTLVYTIGEKMAYILKTNVRLISAEWTLREKDCLDISILENLLNSQGVDKNEIKKKVWSHNPYWFAKGYKDYYFPITLN